MVSMLKLSSTARLVHLCLLQVVCSTVYAIDVTYGVDLSLARFDNINRQQTPPAEKEWVETVTGRLNLVENSADLTANANLSVSSINYRNDQVQDTTVTNLILNSLWIIQPRHFEWFLSDVFTQTVVDPLASNTQSNRQDANAFLTGPNYYWRLNSRHNINFEARLGSIRFENQAGDNDRLTTATRWQYLVNSALTMRLNLEIDKIDLKDDTQSDYTNSNLYLSADYTRGRNTFEAEAGITRIDYDSQDDSTGQRYRLAVDNQRTRTSNIRLEYSRLKTDTGTQLFTATSGTGSIGGVAGSSVANDVFTSENYLLNYNKTLVSGSYRINLSRNELRYETQITLDTIRDAASLQGTYNFSQTSSFTLEGTRTDTTFTNQTPERKDKDYLLRASYIYNVSQELRLSLVYETNERKSTDITSQYEDKSITVTLSYTPR